MEVNIKILLDVGGQQHSNIHINNSLVPGAPGLEIISLPWAFQ